MNEKDLLEQLKASAEQITPPESLRPENIEKMLTRQTASAPGQPAHKQKTDTASPTKNGSSAAPAAPAAAAKKRRFSVYRMGGLAAAFAVAIIGSWQAGRLSVNQNMNTASDLMVADTERQSDRLLSEAETKAAGAEAPQKTEAAAETAGTEAPLPDTKAAAESAPEKSTELAVGSTILDTETAEVPDTETAAVLDTEAPAAEPVEEVLTPAGSYETVYQVLYDTFGSPSDQETGIAESMEYYAVAEDTADAGTGANLSAGQMARDSASYGSPSYSTTNVQEAGVDEGDLVKTDGTYLYILKRSGSLIIVDAGNGEVMAAVSHVKLNVNEQPQEMYVDGDKLSLITSEYYTEMDNSSENVISSCSGYRTKLYTYDISRREDPVLAGTFSQDGSYSQSRKNGKYIYLFSQFSPKVLDTYEASEIIPRTSSGEIDASDVYMPDHLNYSSYLVVSSIDINNPQKAADQKAVVSVPSTFYVSQENIYIANETWNGNETRTDLMKLHYADGIITGTAAGSLEGFLKDSFSLNEYNGYLRAVTTSYDEDYNESNGLYVLDQNLKLVSAIRDLAPDETIRSARFLGDTGYFVTFRQMDPLFSVDLSDPANPKILGDLKISGFSTYLHFYSDTLLLGLGYEADPNTGIQTGLKLSMFDISDPSDVKEVSKLVLNGITWCESLEDYKSILIDPEKNIFGFTCDDRYLVFSYDKEKGFVKEFIYDFYNDIIAASHSEHNSVAEDKNTQEDIIDPGFTFGYGYSSDSTTRGLYIGDVLYLVRPDAVTAFDMTDGYQELGHLIFE